MRVQLDQDQWEIADSATLNDVLIRLSDTAQAKGRLIMTLQVGDRMLTDRDLLPSVLARPVGEVGVVVATSQAVDAVIMSGADHAKAFGASLKQEGETLVERFRKGELRFRQFDEWLGQLADYIEWAELAKSVTVSDTPRSPAAWLAELLKAREVHDTVRLADILEYEILPRLPDTQEDDEP